MILSEKNIDILSKAAIKAAVEAGSLIQNAVNSDFKIMDKKTGSSIASNVVTEVDFKSQECILKILNPLCHKFDLALLTEESPDDKCRFEKDYFWCIDPLDGTLPFTESVSGYAVSIALVTKTGLPVIGVVYNPREELLYTAIHGKGFLFNQKEWMPGQNNKEAFALIFDRSFEQHPLFEKLKHDLLNTVEINGYKNLEVIKQGGAALNAVWTLERQNAIYLKFPKPKGGSIWDYAATACIYNETGQHVSDIFGQPLDLNRKDSTFLNHKGILFSPNNEMAQWAIDWFKSNS